MRKLEEVAINDVLPFKAARRNAIANLKSLEGDLGHWRLNFDGFTYIRYAAPHYTAGTVSIASVYRVGKNSGSIFRHLA